MACPNQPANGGQVTLYYVQQNDDGTIPDSPELTPMLGTGGLPQLATEKVATEMIFDGSREVAYQTLVSMSTSGDHSFELTSGYHSELYAAVFYGEWRDGATIDETVSVTVTGGKVGTITRASGSFSADVLVGGHIIMTGGANTEPMLVTAVSDLELDVISSQPLIAETDAAVSMKVGGTLTPGITCRKYTIFAIIRNLDGEEAIFAYRDVVFTAATIGRASSSVIGGTVSMIGGEMDPAVSSLPANATIKAFPAGMRAFNGGVGASSVGGVKQRFINSVDITFDNGANAEYELDELTPSHVSVGKFAATVSASGGMHTASHIIENITGQEVELNYMMAMNGTSFGVSFPRAEYNETTAVVDGVGTMTTSMNMQGFTKYQGPSVILHRIEAEA